MQLKIKIIRDNVILPSYKTKGSSGLDLCAAVNEPVLVRPLQRLLIPTGLIVEIEEGYEGQVRPRSGLSIKNGITLVNCVGTIDSDYRGEVCLPIINLSEIEYTIMPNERIAQLVISKFEKVNVKVVEEIAGTERGEGGFGSTGK